MRYYYRLNARFIYLVGLMSPAQDKPYITITRRKVIKNDL